MFRIIIGKTRYFYYKKLRRKYRSVDSEFAVVNTVDHNVKSLSKFGFTRMDRIIKPLSAIETQNDKTKFLIIGPRNEEDLLNLSGHGFPLKNIRGFDLISYSPLIDVGDMHAMPYDDNSFDTVICGWTIAYSNTPEKAATEFLRVVKHDGLIAISLEYSELTNEDQVKKLGYALNDTRNRTNSTESLKALFQNHIDKVYFEHDAPMRISHTLNETKRNVSSIVLIFSVKK